MNPSSIHSKDIYLKIKKKKLEISLLLIVQYFREKK